jgi:hypothetical protein
VRLTQSALFLMVGLVNEEKLAAALAMIVTVR